jgi:hypothetical protein
MVKDHLDCLYAKQFTLSKTSKSEEEKDNLLVTNFKLYPSVTADLVYWQASSKWEECLASVTIYDSTGRLISSEKTKVSPAGTYQISFTGKPEGTYLVEIRSELFNEYARVILKR